MRKQVDKATRLPVGTGGACSSAGQTPIGSPANSPRSPTPSASEPQLSASGPQLCARSPLLGAGAAAAVAPGAAAVAPDVDDTTAATATEPPRKMPRILKMLGSDDGVGEEEQEAPKGCVSWGGGGGSGARPPEPLSDRPGVPHDATLPGEQLGDAHHSHQVRRQK